MDFLYQNGINIVHNSRGVIYCNGEIIHQENVGTIKDIVTYPESNNIDLTGWESPNDNPVPPSDVPPSDIPLSDVLPSDIPLSDVPDQ